MIGLRILSHQNKPIDLVLDASGKQLASDKKI
jgi:hypothetical protein